jgi:hypothetical protein
MGADRPLPACPTSSREAASARAPTANPTTFIRGAIRESGLLKGRSVSQSLKSLVERTLRVT